MPRPKKVTRVSDSEKVWHVAVYIRLSKEDGEDESLSIVNQKKIIMEHLEQYFDGEYVIIDYYVDDGVTGTGYERPDFQRMLSDVEAKKVDCVICKTLSRAFRNYADQGYFLEDFFARHETRFISIGSPAFDSFKNPDAVHGLEVPIAGLMNDRYAAKTSEDIRRTFNMKRRKGEFIGAFAPYGYAKDPTNKNRLIIDEEAAQVVRNIYRWYVEDGMSKMGIVKLLNEQGIPNPSTYKRRKGFNYNNPSTHMDDGLWATLTISRMLSNEVYIGHMVQGRQKIISYKVHDRIDVPSDKWFVIENTHAPIVSKELFDKAQDLGRRNTRTPNREKKVWPLSGFVRCADCGKALNRKMSFELSYYYCRTYEKMKGKCTKHAIREDLISEALLAAIQVQVKLVEKLEDSLDRLHEAPNLYARSSHIESQLAGRKQEYVKLRRASDSLYVDWKNDMLSKEEYVHMKSTFDAQLGQIEKAIAALESEQHRWEDGRAIRENPLFVNFCKHRGITQLDRGVIVALVDTIFIHANKEITVRFVYADQYERLLSFLERLCCGVEGTQA